MLGEAMRQVPGLTIMLFMLLAFLQHLDKVNARHDQVQREATAAMRDTAKVMGENSGVLREVSALLRKMNGGDRH